MINLALERVKIEDHKRRSEFETLRSEIESLQTAYAAKQRQLASRTFYHFGRLPIEIASAIFCDVVEVDYTQVVGLSHVCRDWRRVVIEMPALWSHLSLSSRNPGAKAKLWKQRSRGKISSFTLHGGRAEPIWALDLLNDVPFDHLRSLCLTDVDWFQFRKRLPLLTNDAISSLESFHIDGVSWVPSIDWLFELPSLQLRSLTILNTDIDCRGISNTCTDLTTLCYQGRFNQAYRTDLLALLHRNPKLEKLHLNMAIKSTTIIQPERERRIPLPESFCILPNLLELSLEGSELMPETLTSVMMPSKLQVVRFTKCTGALDDALRHILALRISPHLQELVIDRCIINDPSNLIKLLHGATSLRVLRLTSLYNIKGVLDALSEATPDSTGAPHILLPSLLQLDLSHCPEVRDGPLIRVVKFRIPPQQDLAEEAPSSYRQPPQLTSLALHTCDISPDVIQWLRKQVPHVDYMYATKKQASWKR